MAVSFAERAISYYCNLSKPTNLPPGIDVLNPYRTAEVQHIVQAFFGKYFADNQSRIFVLGINPGRFGAGVTGISFTTPQNLDRYCDIPNSLPPTPELSSQFVYQVVEAFGGATAFYSRFFLTSLFPLALVKAGKNYNFYDDRATTEALWPAITEAVRTQLDFGADRRVAVCLGRKNEVFLRRLNEQEGFFERIVTLDHPRYILQYKSRSADAYVEQYIQTLYDCLPV